MNDPNHPHRLSNKIFSFVMRVGHNLSRKFRSVFKFINRSRKILIMQIYGVFHSHTSKGYNKFIVYLSRVSVHAITPYISQQYIGRFCHHSLEFKMQISNDLYIMYGKLGENFVSNSLCNVRWPFVYLIIYHMCYLLFQILTRKAAICTL